jgi:hypothetical protein
MTAPDPTRLLFGPYRTPRCKVGKKLTCEVRGDVEVKAISDGRIPWPMTRRGRSRLTMIVCGGLAEAVRRESVAAVCHWWGVGVTTVWKWRKALGVEQYNEGTSRLQAAYTPVRLTPEVRAKAQAAAHTPEANVKKAAAKLGKPPHPATLAALERYRGKPSTEESRRKNSEAHKRLGTRPPAARPAWSEADEALLGAMDDAEVARRTGRTVNAVSIRRHRLGIPHYNRNS